MKVVNSKQIFAEVGPGIDYPEMERRILEFWRTERIFHRSLEHRKEGKAFVFYEGPPTANGRPGAHHVLARAYKDIICRFRSMEGYYVERKAGWDTHGLPVELEVERELGLAGKPEIEQYGIERFNERCRESVLRYKTDWEELTERMAYWVDMDNAYVTFTNEYIESVWWSLKALWDKNLLYEGHKVVPYCPRCGTSLSSHEVALGYQNVTEPSVYVKVRAQDEPDTHFLVWTTTPWTLPGNVALAVHPDLTYALVEADSQRFIVLEDLAEPVLGEDFQVVERFAGRELAGRGYEPMFDFYPSTEASHRVVEGDFVTTTEGTGIVHIAPAYGEIDLEVGRRYNLPVRHPVDLEGRFNADVPPWTGRFVKEADPDIIRELEGQGKILKVIPYEHSYPFCWRCDTPLLYYAKTSWFIRSTDYRDRMVKLNQEGINWVPTHIKEGRFGQWLENLVDWALSRERYWGTPLPIWRCVECGQTECVGSLEELESRAGAAQFAANRPENGKLDLHRPYVDEIVLSCPSCSSDMRRVPEVIDAWYDSGAMPFSQWHYPFENKEKFEKGFPADFISEAIDQTRGWFFSLHALGAMLFDDVTYKNVICLGHILDEKGEKMSKHKGNVIAPWTILTREGADAFRWYLFTVSPAGSPKKFSEEGVLEVLRKFLLTLWNTYSFFITYANIDGFDPREHKVAPADRPLMDRWLVSRVEGLTEKVRSELSGYAVTAAARALAEFVDDLSNWYVRRSRRRFWKSVEDTDKVSAYLTLYEALTRTIKLLAPFTPFITEAVYQNLVRSLDEQAVPSVHMADFPQADLSLVDQALEERMEAARRIVVLGRAARTRSRVKIRQPLPELRVLTPDGSAGQALDILGDQIKEELNVREVLPMKSLDEFISYIVRPNFSLLGPRYGPLVPQIEKAIRAVDARKIREKLLSSGEYRLEIDGQSVTLSGEEIHVDEVAKEEYVVESGAGYCVALSTEITPELRKEGLAREFVHFVQAARKDAGFEIADRIALSVKAPDELSEALREHASYVQSETLADELSLQGELPGFQRDGRIGGMDVAIAVSRRGS